MDTVLRGIIAGFFTTIPYAGIDWFLYLIGVTPFTVVHYGAVLITPPNTALTVVPLILGLIAVMTVGSLVGAILSIMIRATGTDYIYIKILGAFFVLWIVHVSILPRLLEPELFRVLPIVTIIVNFFIKVIWAITYAYLILTFNKHKKNKLTTN